MNHIGAAVFSGNVAKRKGRAYTDQHGREWSAFVETATNRPAGNIRPNGWVAPWYPDGKYLLLDDEKPNQLVIDYDTWLDDEAQAVLEYKEQQIIMGTALHGQAYRIEEHGSTPAMIRAIGVPPMMLEPIKAMKQGNKFALGLSKTVDSRLQAFMPDKPKKALVEDGIDYSGDAGEVEAEPVKVDKRTKAYRESQAVAS